MTTTDFPLAGLSLTDAQVARITEVAEQAGVTVDELRFVRSYLEIEGFTPGSMLRMERRIWVALTGLTGGILAYEARAAGIRAIVETIARDVLLRGH